MQGLSLPPTLTTIGNRHREQAEAFRAQHGLEARSWYRITNTADEAEVMLYDEIGGWFGATADQFIADLRGITAPSLRVRVNSPGGSVFEGVAIANALRSHPSNITVQVDGIAASIASVIAMAGDRIVMAPNTMLMIHDASGMCMGNAQDMDEMSELLDLISDNIADAYATRAGGTREQWRARMKTETWYLPEDAVAAGLADEAQAPQAGTPAPAEPEPQPEPEREPDMRRAFDPAAYGYHGPRPARPEPEQQPTMVISIADALDEDAIARLRAAVASRPEPLTPGPVPQELLDAIDAEAAQQEQHVAAVETHIAAAEDDADPKQPAPETPAPDPWAEMVAHLIEPAPDPWAALTSHLTEPTASPAATDA
ncbi:head maturation protease, ClpP-related [Streptomyces jumonjinensis]|uniref:head maturation protease, ClpP-related n=1 Tax=Streptomyces jumonjinensis TaxID=1945 RepID=UPI0037B5F88C